MKVLKFFKKTNANNKRSIEIFINKILHLKPINNKKQVVLKTQMNSNMKVTQELLMSKKCKTKLRVMMMTMEDLIIMVMMMMMLMIMILVMLKLKMMMTMMIMLMMVKVMMMKVILLMV